MLDVAELANELYDLGQNDRSDSEYIMVALFVYGHEYSLQNMCRLSLTAGSGKFTTASMFLGADAETETVRVAEQLIANIEAIN